MVSCHHESCGCEERVWLPTDNSSKSEAVLHPWCIHCGLVKNISDGQSHRIGYWMNVLSKVTYRFSFTQCQKRLIAKELEANECFDDTYGTSGSAQKDVFIRIVGKYCGLRINTRIIDSFIY